MYLFTEICWTVNCTELVQDAVQCWTFLVMVLNLFLHTSRVYGEILGSHGGGFEEDCSGMLHRVVWQKLIDVSGVLTVCIAVTMEAVGSKHFLHVSLFLPGYMM
jgi:hypothetical protein